MPYDQAEYMKVYNAEQYQKKKLFVQRVKSFARCAECDSKFHHSAMEFDHVRGKKKMSIAKMRARHSMAALKAEMRKCEIVCANCHAYRTWVRAQPDTRL